MSSKEPAKKKSAVAPATPAESPKPARRSALGRIKDAITSALPAPASRAKPKAASAVAPETPPVLPAPAKRATAKKAAIATPPVLPDAPRRAAAKKAVAAPAPVVPPVVASAPVTKPAPAPAPAAAAAPSAASKKRPAAKKAAEPPPAVEGGLSSPPPSAPRPPASADSKVRSPAPAAASPAPPPIPAILAEGDFPPAPPAGGPGDRYVLGPGVPVVSPTPPGELPAAYGTGRLLLVARDPHWLYAHWDFTDEQLRGHNAKSASGALALRLFQVGAGDEPIAEIAVHPESRNWFAHVPAGGARYTAELGYRDQRKRWTSLARSGETLTPPDRMSEETWVRFETLPASLSLARLVELVQRAVAEHVPLWEAVRQLRATGFPELPLPVPGAPAPWTPEQAAAIAALVSMDEVRRVWIGSLEITELVKRQLSRELASGALVGELAALGGLGSVSSPFGGGPSGARGFWFNVNAELIVYGATDPAATVTIGGREIRLRPDGSFSYRFALPDGEYALPITATSPDRVEARSADLAFRRASEYHGEVGRHPQDEGLKAPKVENTQ